jgi:hypothetical protein
MSNFYWLALLGGRRLRMGVWDGIGKFPANKQWPLKVQTFMDNLAMKFIKSKQK